MGKIFYSVSGEGRGHATRVRTIVDELRQDYSVRIYAPGLAYEFLAGVYSASEVAVRRIPGLHFTYSASHRLNYLKSGWNSLAFVRHAPAVVARLARDIERHKPDLVITDFEPLLPRAARRCGVPYVSLDHQHFLVTSDLSDLPWKLRAHAASMSGFVRAFVHGQERTVVSSFYFPKLRSDVQRVTQIGVLLRQEVRQAQVHSGEHIIAYLRRFAAREVMSALRACKCPVHVYGLGERSATGNLRFLAIDAERFVADLASSRALVSTAGNQLVGEALYLGKPILAIPEPGNFEQQINGHFLQYSGCGLCLDCERVTIAHLRQILDHADEFAGGVDREQLCGNEDALRAINEVLIGNGTLSSSLSLHDEATTRTMRNGF